MSDVEIREFGGSIHLWDSRHRARVFITSTDDGLCIAVGDYETYDQPDWIQLVVADNRLMVEQIRTGDREHRRFKSGEDPGIDIGDFCLKAD